MSSLVPDGGNTFWSSFAHDPRDPAFATLRAADGDRSLVCDLLAQAYADGRLTPTEHDQRQSAALTVTTLGEIPALVDGLVAGPSGTAVIHAKAVQMHRESLQETLAVLVVPSTICWVIWLITDREWFPWPLWVMLGTSLPFLLTVVGSRGAIRNNERKLTRKGWEG